MRPSRRQFSLGSLMVAIAILAVALAYPIVPSLLLFLFVGLVLIPLVIFLVLIAPGILLIEWADRQADARESSAGRRPFAREPSTEGIVFVDPGPSGG